MIVGDNEIIQIVVESIVVYERPFPDMGPSLHFKEVRQCGNLRGEKREKQCERIEECKLAVENKHCCCFFGFLRWPCDGPPS